MTEEERKLQKRVDDLESGIKWYFIFDILGALLEAIFEHYD